MDGDGSISLKGNIEEYHKLNGDIIAVKKDIRHEIDDAVIKLMVKYNIHGVNFDSIILQKGMGFEILFKPKENVDIPDEFIEEFKKLFQIAQSSSFFVGTKFIKYKFLFV